MRIVLVGSLMLVCFVFVGFGQGGGKAEPNRIQFAAGKSSKVLTGTLKKGEEMEYVFGAKAGQKVTIKNPSTGLFDFRVFSEENFSEGDFDSSPTYTFEVPADGDYMLFIRRKVGGPRSARFSITLAIK